jgi:hypothetical protein
MKKYLQAILVFNVALPALLIGLPFFALLWAVLRFQGFVAEKAEDHANYETQSLQVTKLGAELRPIKEKVVLLKGLLSNEDIEAKLGAGIAAALEKLSSDDIEQTLHDVQFGASAIGPNYGDGRRLSLKFSSRWESLNAATAEWETRFPNLVLETLSIDLQPGSTLGAPYLQSTLSYFVITEN